MPELTFRVRDLAGNEASRVVVVETVAPTRTLANPFPAGSFWVRPLPSSPVVDPNSASHISHFLANKGSALLTLRRYATATAKVSPGDPTYNVTATRYTSNFDRYGPIPIPVGTRPDPGGDGHLAVFDTATGREWGFWQAIYNSAADSWSASSGHAMDLDTEINVPSAIAGLNDANFPGLAGIVRAEEIAAGEINHPLVYQTPARGGGSARFPATNNAGSGTGLPNGALLQLNPTLDVSGLPGWEQVIARALQQYGMYMRDGSSGTTDIVGENPINRGNPWADLLGWMGNYQYFSGGFPWNQMRVLSPPSP